MSWKYVTLDHPLLKFWEIYNDPGHYLSKLSFASYFPILYSYFCVIVSSFVIILSRISPRFKDIIYFVIFACGREISEKPSLWGIEIFP